MSTPMDWNLEGKSRSRPEWTNEQMRTHDFDSVNAVGFAACMSGAIYTNLFEIMQLSDDSDAVFAGPGRMSASVRCDGGSNQVWR